MGIAVSLWPTRRLRGREGERGGGGDGRVNEKGMGVREYFLDCISVIEAVHGCVDGVVTVGAMKVVSDNIIGTMLWEL